VQYSFVLVLVSMAKACSRRQAKRPQAKRCGWKNDDTALQYSQNLARASNTTLARGGRHIEHLNSHLDG